MNLFVKIIWTVNSTTGPENAAAAAKHKLTTELERRAQPFNISSGLPYPEYTQRRQQVQRGVIA
jgi:hypothetical protein